MLFQSPCYNSAHNVLVPNTRVWMISTIRAKGVNISKNNTTK